MPRHARPSARPRARTAAARRFQLSQFRCDGGGTEDLPRPRVALDLACLLARRSTTIVARRSTTYDEERGGEAMN